MKLRHVFSTQDATHARHAVRILHEHGIPHDAISLVANADIELEQIPNRMKEADTDFVPAAIRGLGIGGATGLFAGLVAMVVPGLGITIAGAAALGAAAGRGRRDPAGVRDAFRAELMRRGSETKNPRVREGFCSIWCPEEDSNLHEVAPAST